MPFKQFILAGFILLKLVLQYQLVSPVYELHRDEFLHLDLGHHLAWGYRSVPPFTAWVSALIGILGNSEFWVKFFPALFGALTILVVWKTIEVLKGNLFALVLGSGAVLCSALLRLNTLYQPNSFDALCWTTLYFLVIKYLSTRRVQWLYWAAVAFALGFLNKYNIVFLVLGLLPALLLTSQRHLFLTRHMGISILLALLLIAPNLVWQYQHQFPVITHLNELAETQLVNVDPWSFLRSQLLFYFGSILVIFAGLYALLTYPPFIPFKPFFAAFVFTLGIFVFLKAKDYYAIGLYPVYLAFGAVYLEERLQGGWARYFKPVLIALPLVFLLLTYQWIFPVRHPEYIHAHGQDFQRLGLLRWEDGKDHVLPQDFADMLGWKELAAKVDSAYLQSPAQEQTLVLCDNYGQAGAINYYTRQNIRAVSFNGDYIDWFDLSKNYKHLIRIKNARERLEELQETAPYFQSARITGAIANSYAREFGTTVFLFTYTKTDINERIKTELEEALKQKE